MVDDEQAEEIRATAHQEGCRDCLALLKDRKERKARIDETDERIANLEEIIKSMGLNLRADQKDLIAAAKNFVEENVELIEDSSKQIVARFKAEAKLAEKDKRIAELENLIKFDSLAAAKAQGKSVFAHLEYENETLTEQLARAREVAKEAAACFKLYWSPGLQNSRAWEDLTKAMDKLRAVAEGKEGA